MTNFKPARKQILFKQTFSLLWGMGRVVQGPIKLTQEKVLENAVRPYGNHDGNGNENVTKQKV